MDGVDEGHWSNVLKSPGEVPPGTKFSKGLLMFWGIFVLVCSDTSTQTQSRNRRNTCLKCTSRSSTSNSRTYFKYNKYSIKKVISLRINQTDV